MQEGCLTNEYGILRPRNCKKKFCAFCQKNCHKSAKLQRFERFRILEGTARYAGLLVAPAEGSSKTKSFVTFVINLSNFEKNPKNPKKNPKMSNKNSKKKYKINTLKNTK